MSRHKNSWCCGIAHDQQWGEKKVFVSSSVCKLLFPTVSYMFILIQCCVKVCEPLEVTLFRPSFLHYLVINIISYPLSTEVQLAEHFDFMSVLMKNNPQVPTGFSQSVHRFTQSDAFPLYILRIHRIEY